MNKIEAYSRSVKGKLRMKEKVDEYISDGVTQTGGGGKILTPDEMEKAAATLASCIRATAMSYDLPASVMKNINSISATKPYQTANGEWRVDLFFTDDLSRESLYSEQYDGIVNIIALFNNGYLARDTVYGFWDNHEYTGEWNVLRVLPGANFAYIRSKIGRPALQFIQEAVRSFNISIGNSLGAKVILDDIYEEIPTVAKI
jgi:hypothetical protein